MLSFEIHEMKSSIQQRKKKETSLNNSPRETDSIV